MSWTLSLIEEGAKGQTGELFLIVGGGFFSVGGDGRLETVNFFWVGGTLGGTLPVAIPFPRSQIISRAGKQNKNEVESGSHSSVSLYAIHHNCLTGV